MSARLRRRSESTTRRLRREPMETPPNSLSLRGLATIVGVSAVFVACGTWLLAVQFEARDYEMATRKKQEELFAARDALKDLEAEAGRLHRDEFLREAAMGPLGMVDPLPVSLSEMRVDAGRQRERAAAAVKARAAMARERIELETFPKEAR
jgi:hypothetical protein